MTTNILGVSAFYHDSAAALLCEGEIVAAAQEERFTRKKNDSSFPHYAIASCLAQKELTMNDIDYVVFYEDPNLKFHRLLTSFHFTAPHSLPAFLAAMPSWLTEKVWLDSVIANELAWKKRVHFCDHHVSHGASAFYPSPFDSAAILTIDGVGEWSTTTIGLGNSEDIELVDHIKYPHSLGLLYSAFTSYLGFRINNGEYKVMGLAPYCAPKYVKQIKENLIHLNKDGSFLINQAFFGYTRDLCMFNSDFVQLFGIKKREPESKLKQFHADVAASIQAVTSEAVIGLAKRAKEVTKADNLVLAGGVALNCVANGLLKRSGMYEDVWIQPAAGDAGGALGCALWFWHKVLGKKRSPKSKDSMQFSFLGPKIETSSEDDDENLRKMGAVYQTFDDDELAQKVAECLENGKVVAVARDSMEWGPRALGNRSIFADAKNVDMLQILNAKVKKREAFRPFAPMVLEEHTSEWFNCDGDSPYMLFVHEVAHSKCSPRLEGLSPDMSLVNEVRSQIPAVTHVDYTARIQTVGPERPFARKILECLKNKTGCPVMVNTSFNKRGEPIVCTAIDAFKSFASTDIDYLVIGNKFFARQEQLFQLLSDFDEPSSDDEYITRIELNRRAKEIDRTAIVGLLLSTVLTLYCGVHAIFALIPNATLYYLGAILGSVSFISFLLCPGIFIPVVDKALQIPKRVAGFILSVILSGVYFSVVTPIGWFARKSEDNPFTKWTDDEDLSNWHVKSKDEQKANYTPTPLPWISFSRFFGPLAFFVRHRIWFTFPALFILLLLGLLFFFIENSVVAPLIYPVF